MRYTITFPEYLIKHLLETEEFSQNRQRIEFILSIEGSKVKVTRVH